jgi:hypothetical protein
MIRRWNSSTPAPTMMTALTSENHTDDRIRAAT